MHSGTVLISGASIAGPALARWLGRNGFDVTVVEKAGSPRPGGQAVDFKGATHRRVLDQMGVYDAVAARQTAKTDWRIVDESDRVQAVIPGEFIGGDLEILRGDLSDVIRGVASEGVEYVFDDEIVGLRERGDGVEAAFARRGTERFDLVIGADGVHSAVRRLGFGPEKELVQPLGYWYAVASGTAAADGLQTHLPSGRGVAFGYNVPGRLALVGGQKSPNLFVFSSTGEGYDRHDRSTQLRLVEEAFRGLGWRVGAMLDACADAPDFYLDALARTRMSTFTRGRLALVGDAGYANTLGGFGTGLAIVGAYVLAGELAGARGDHEAAFQAYDRRMRSLTKIARTGNAGPFLAPASPGRIRTRNWSFTNRLMYRTMQAMTDRFATDERIPRYPLR
ncbi:FAD-dependent monooxygenase [Galbitalea sp. SE-J8]|uniref:FAD-dependent monooxygenase n=1 Tax=Galbitalea sp. SE-J8 TaxID=3054952 RepID=UPI00259CC48C|nr:FAD-dependent monooxygenase [Galbitalea sp. SE-J8]MDM4761724.1 FAD-dependent monooxygenase [Galbitalea sp. SE-J8]